MDLEAALRRFNGSEELALEGELADADADFRSYSELEGPGAEASSFAEASAALSQGASVSADALGKAYPRNPRRFETIEGGRVYQALYVESKSVLDALCRVKKCLRRSM